MGVQLKLVRSYTRLMLLSVANIYEMVARGFISSCTRVENGQGHDLWGRCRDIATRNRIGCGTAVVVEDGRLSNDGAPHYARGCHGGYHQRLRIG